MILVLDKSYVMTQPDFPKKYGIQDLNRFVPKNAKNGLESGGGQEKIPRRYGGVGEWSHFGQSLGFFPRKNPDFCTFFLLF